MSAGGIATPSDLAEARPRFLCRWIAGPWTDLPWLIGGALGGYGLFFLYAVVGWPMEMIWLVWYVLLDIPHFFGTYVRTYLDPVERARRPALLYGSLLLPAVGPLMLLLGYGLFLAGHSELHLLPFHVLVAFVMLWAYWHVVRQHYGILSLYKRKNGDATPADYWIDSGLLYGGLLLPLVPLVLLHPDARWHLGLPEAQGSWEAPAISAAAWLIAGLALLFLWRQVVLACRGEALNLAKLLFLLAVVPLHVFVGWHPATFATSLLGFAAFVTIFHDLQYHAIVWHAQQMKLARAPDPSRHGLSALVSRNLLVFLGCATAMGVASWLVGCSLDIRPGCVPILRAKQVGLFGHVTLEHLLAGVVLGFIMHHYLVDQFIWRPSKDEAVRKDLAS